MFTHHSHNTRSVSVNICTFTPPVEALDLVLLGPRLVRRVVLLSFFRRLLVAQCQLLDCFSVLLQQFSARLLLVIRLGEPRMLLDLVQRGPVAAFVGQHPHNEVLEFLGQMLTLDLVEVLLRLPGDNQVVEIFVLSRFLEREYASHNDEEDDAR